MSSNSSSPKASPSLLSSLRKFRFQRSVVVNGEVKNESLPEKASPIKSKLNTSVESVVKSPGRRIVGRIIDSDSDEVDSDVVKTIAPQDVKVQKTNNTSNNKDTCKRNNVIESDEDIAVASNDNLKVLTEAFPDMDEMELLDVLARNGMDLQKAMNCLIDNNSNSHKEKQKHSVITIDDDDDEGRQELNGTIQRHWKRINKGLVALTGKKTKKHKRNDDSDADDDDEANPFKEHKVYKSEDSDEEENEVDYTVLTSDQKAVLEFFSTATFLELAAVPTCSRKKAEIIISLRPLESWSDLVQKLQNSKSVGTDLLNASHSVLRLRKVITRLMNQCKQLSERMKEIVRSVTSGELKGARINVQPVLIPSDLKLASYQMIGLNWLYLMNKQGLSGILADEMGLGKTVQVIALLAYLKQLEMEDKKDQAVSDDENSNNQKDEDFDENAKTHLIVVPSSTLENWKNEFERWCPTLNVTLYFGSQEDRQQIRYQWLQEGFNGVDVIITTYHMVAGTAEGKMFRKLPLDYVIFDEAHMLKNMATQRYENLIKIKGNHRILLTGTPLQNNLVELMSLLVFVMPGMFAGKKEYLKQLFSMYPRQSTSNNPAAVVNQRDESHFEREQVRRAKEIMRPFFLRRLKQDVLQDLPKKTEKVLYVPLADSQNKLYQRLIGQYSKDADEIVHHFDEEPVNNVDCDDPEPKAKRNKKDPSSKPAPKPNEPSGLSIMMYLRKVANHPLLIRTLYDDANIKKMAMKLQKDSLYPEENLQYIIEDLSILCDFELHRLCLGYKSILEYKLEKNILMTSGKFMKFDEIFPNLKKEGHRVLIFSQFIMMMDLIGNYLAANGYRFLRLDGATPVPERQSMIDEYNRDEEIFAFILSTRAGGMGINLTAADTVIIHDLDFNPYNDKQAEDRCHRVGQCRDVTIMRFISKDTIEEGIYQTAQEKLNLEREITTNDEGTENVKDGKKENILRLLKQILCHDSKTSSQAT